MLLPGVAHRSLLQIIHPNCLLLFFCVSLWKIVFLSHAACLDVWLALVLYFIHMTPLSPQSSDCLLLSETAWSTDFSLPHLLHALRSHCLVRVNSRGRLFQFHVEYERNPQYTKKKNVWKRTKLEESYISISKSVLWSENKVRYIDRWNWAVHHISVVRRLLRRCQVHSAGREGVFSTNDGSINGFPCRKDEVGPRFHTAYRI